MAIVKKPAGSTTAKKTPAKETEKKVTAPAKETKAPAKATAPKATKAPAKKTAPAKVEEKKTTSAAFEVDLSNETSLKKNDFCKLLANSVNEKLGERDNNPLRRNLTLVESEIIFEAVQDIMKEYVFGKGMPMYFCGSQITKRPMLGRTYPALLEGAKETYKEPHYRMSMSKEIGGTVHAGTINEDGTFTCEDGTVINVEEANEAFSNN